MKMGRKITKNTIRSLPYKAEVNCWKCVLLFWSKGESVVAITIRHLIDYKVILTLTTRSFSPIPIFTYIGDGFPDRTRVQVNCVHRRINCWWCKKHQFVNLNIKSRESRDGGQEKERWLKVEMGRQNREGSEREGLKKAMARART